VATAWFAVEGGYEYNHEVRMMARDFYGVVRTRDREVEGVKYRAMYHGASCTAANCRRAVQEHAERLFRPTSGYGRLFAHSTIQGPSRVTWA